VTLDAIQAHLERAGLAKYKWPERLELVERLPLTPTGKIMRYALRESARR
jgi:non-ribosomal peptide synthetase component E (peptide arylation enzyme)